MAVSRQRERSCSPIAEIHEVLGSKRNQGALASLAVTSCLADATCFAVHSSPSVSTSSQECSSSSTRWP